VREYLPYVERRREKQGREIMLKGTSCSHHGEEEHDGKENGDGLLLCRLVVLSRHSAIVVGPHCFRRISPG